MNIRRLVNQDDLTTDQKVQRIMHLAKRQAAFKALLAGKFKIFVQVLLEPLEFAKRGLVERRTQNSGAGLRGERRSSLLGVLEGQKS